MSSKNKTKIDKKRSFNNIDDKENKKLKKQKKNDHMKSNNNEINFSKQTTAQLKDIATSLGVLFKNSTKKKEILKQIKLFDKRKQDQDILAFVKQEIHSNINSFNKGIIEFTIKDGIDQSEWLFWKVFRNKFLYKRIMSNMDKNLSLSYDSITSVAKMLGFNQIGILRDKVINRHHLSFLNKASDIFNYIKSDNDQDRLFYSKLFSNYGRYLFSFFIKPNVFGLPQELIQSKCIPALQILIKEYKYQPSANCLERATDYGSIKILKLLFQQVQINDNLKCEITKKLTQSFEFGLQSYKSLQYLKNENIIDVTVPIQTTDELNEINNDCILKRFLKERSSEVQCEMTLKILIIICKLILSIKTFSTNGIIGIKEIESFSGIHFTRKELKLPLSDKQFQIVEKKEFIKKLLKLNHLFNQIENELIPEFYYLYYHIDNEIDYYGQGEGSGNIEFLAREINRKSKNHDEFGTLLALEFGNFQMLNFYFKKCPKEYLGKIVKTLLEYINSNNKNKYDGHKLFSFCPNKNKQISFIDSLVNDIITKNESSTNNPESRTPEESYFIIDPETLFYLLIDYNDVDLVEYYETKFKSMHYEYRMGYDQLSMYIQPKSISMLDYLFKKGYTFNVDSIWWFKSIYLFDHYLELVKKNNVGKMVVSTFLSIHSKYIIPIVKHLIETSDPNLYDFSLVQHQVYTYIFISHLPSDEKFEISKLFFIKFHIGQFKRSKIFFNGYSTGLKKFLNWLFINYNDRLIQTNVHKNKNIHLVNQIDSLIYFETNRFDQINDTIPFHQRLVFLVSQSQDITLLDLLLKRFQSSNKSKGIDDFDLLLLLESAVEFGNLKTFEHIHQNYSSLLKPKTNRKDDHHPFTLIQLKSILLKSISFHQIVLSEFLFLIIVPKLTKSEILKKSNHFTKEYFGNKLK